MAGQGAWDAIVIGGGLAGVAATRDLRKAGRTVLLLEARERLGGRTYYRPFDGLDQSVEFGGTWLDPERQPHLMAEIDRYGLPLGHSPEPTENQYDFGGQRFGGKTPVPPAELLDLERFLYQVMHDARRIPRGVPFDHAGLADLDIAFADYIRPLNLGPATVDFLRSFLGVWFCSRLEDFSALYALYWLSLFDGSPLTLSGSLTTKFGRGTKSLIDALLADADADVRLSAPVQRVVQDSSGVRVTTAQGETFSGGHAVVAVPVNAWSDIDFEPGLNDGKRSVAQAKHPGRALKVWALVKQGPETDGMFRMRTEGGLMWLGNEYQLPEGNLLLAFGNAPELLDVNQREAIASELQEWVPGLEVLAVDAHDWNADPYSQGTWVTFRPGQMTEHWSALLEPEGRVHFAGSDIAPTWTGWMEGAVESGRLAADAIVKAQPTPHRA